MYLQVLFQNIPAMHFILLAFLFSDYVQGFALQFLGERSFTTPVYTNLQNLNDTTACLIQNKKEGRLKSSLMPIPVMPYGKMLCEGPHAAICGSCLCIPEMKYFERPGPNIWRCHLRVMDRVPPAPSIKRAEGDTAWCLSPDYGGCRCVSLRKYWANRDEAFKKAFHQDVWVNALEHDYPDFRPYRNAKKPTSKKKAAVKANNTVGDQVDEPKDKNAVINAEDRGHLIGEGGIETTTGGNIDDRETLVEALSVGELETTETQF